jgi:hypothetical protein
MTTFLQSALCGVTVSVVVLSAGLAQADVIAPAPSAGTRSAELTWISIDPQLEYLQDIDSGEIAIDPSAREIVLILRHAVQTSEPPQEPEEVRLPLVATKRGTCNTTYTARRDGRAYDGPLEVLTVIDYRSVRPTLWPRRPCPRPRAPVFIAYEMVTAGFRLPVLETHSEFGANSLVRAQAVPPLRD